MTLAIRYALRTLIGPWMLLPAIGLEAVLFLQRGMPWRGEGMWTVDWFAISLFIIGPVCAGAAAVDAARLSRPGNIHLVVSVPRPARVYLRAAAWCAVPLIVLHLLAIAVALLVGEVRSPGIGWWAILGAALVQCLAIIWFVTVGSAIGRFSTPLLAGLIGGAGGFVLNYVISHALDSGPQFRLLNLGGATITMVGRAYHPGYLTGQAIIFLLTAALFLLLPLRPRPGYHLPTPAGTVAVLAAIGLIAAGPAVFPQHRYVDVPKPPEMCGGNRPQVCMYDEHRRYADLVNSRVRLLTDAALAKGYPAFVPERIVEESRSYRPSGAGVKSLWLPTQVYEEGRYSVEDAAYFLLLPDCAWVVGEVPTPAGFDRVFFSLLATWLHLAGEELAHAPVEYQILTPDQVSVALAALDRCDLSGLS